VFIVTTPDRLARSVADLCAIVKRIEAKRASLRIIVGLPYRSRIWANNLYQAINGRQDTAWLQGNAEVRARLEVTRKAPCERTRRKPLMFSRAPTSRSPSSSPPTRNSTIAGSP
jgi:hypothetical protein